MKTCALCLCIVLGLCAIAGCNGSKTTEPTPTPTPSSPYAIVDPENVIDSGIIGLPETDLLAMKEDLTRETISEDTRKQIRDCTYLDQQAQIEYFVMDGIVAGVYYRVNTQEDIWATLELFEDIADALEALGGESNYSITMNGARGYERMEFTLETVQSCIEDDPHMLMFDLQWKKESLRISVVGQKQMYATEVVIAIRDMDYKDE